MPWKIRETSISEPLTNVKSRINCAIDHVITEFNIIYAMYVGIPTLWISVSYAYGLFLSKCARAGFYNVVFHCISHNNALYLAAIFFSNEIKSSFPERSYIDTVIIYSHRIYFIYFSCFTQQKENTGYRFHERT